MLLFHLKTWCHFLLWGSNLWMANLVLSEVAAAADLQISNSLPLEQTVERSPTPETYSLPSEELFPAQAIVSLDKPLLTQITPLEVPADVEPSSKAKLVNQIQSFKATDLMAGATQDGVDPAIAPPEWHFAAMKSSLKELSDSRGSINEELDELRMDAERVDSERSQQVTSNSNQLNFFLAADPANPTVLPIPECQELDPDLGCLRLQQPSSSPTNAPPPILFLVPRVDFFRSNNILLGIDPIDDGLFRPSLTLLALPPLGPNTFLVASVEGAFNHYFKVSEFSYKELRIRAGIFQRLSPTMSAEFGWTNQQLFISGDRIRGFPSGTRFLNDHAIRLEVSRRDQLARKLSLSSFYQLRIGFAKPEDRSRILNVLFLSLNYDLTPAVQLGMDYQFAAASFTVTPRTDLYHQLLGRVTINAFRNTQLSVYGGLSFGNSTESGIDFGSYILGVSMSLNLVLF